MRMTTWLTKELFNTSDDHASLADMSFANQLVQTNYIDSACASLVKRLQLSLEPEELLSLFHDEVCVYFTCFNLTFSNDKHGFSSKNTQQGDFCFKVNLFVDDGVFGTLEFDFQYDLSHSQQSLLDTLSEALTQPLFNALKYQYVKDLAFKDCLTGLPNRNQFNTQFRSMLQNCQFNNTPFSLLVIDLDEFKWINDEFGHQTGDLVLTYFAQELLSCCKDIGAVFRLGGDEFTVLVESAESGLVQHIAAKMKQAVLSNRLLAQFKITCSIGSAHSTHGDTFNSLFERADKALYKAKHKGRNCLELSSSELSPSVGFC